MDITYSVDDGLPGSIEVRCVCGETLLSYNSKPTQETPILYTMTATATCKKCGVVSEHQLESYGSPSRTAV